MVCGATIVVTGSGCHRAPPVTEEASIPKVTVARVIPQEVVDSDECIGRTEASEKVEVRARVFVSKGNLLTGGQASGTLLTTIVKEQPMYVYCDVGTNLDMAQVESIARGHGTGQGDHDHETQGGIPGVAQTITISGPSIVQNAIGSNYGTVYVVLDEFHHRHGNELGADAIAAKLRAVCYREVQEASVAVFGAPPSTGLAAPAASRSWCGMWQPLVSTRCSKPPTI